MKKIYICALALSVSSLTFGQNITGKSFEKARLQKQMSSYTPVKVKTNTPINKAPGDTIWQEDFTSGIPTGWWIQDNTGNNAVWVIQPAGFIPASDAIAANSVSTIASTSGGNSISLPMDFYESPIPAGGYYDMDSYFQTNGIQVNNLAGVSVAFQQKFNRCCAINPAPVTVLSVSTDSTFATNFQEYDIIAGIGGNLTSPDPMPMSINISAIAASYTGKIWLRFHVKSGSEAYFWMIDDIAVVESPTNDLTTTSPSYGFFGVQYTRIPVAHIQAADFSMAVNNIGTADQTGSNLTVDINDGAASVFNASTNDTTLNSLSQDTLVMNGSWTPPVALGIPYTVTMDVFSNFTDETPSNNAAAFAPFEVSQYIMALDDYSATPGNGGSQSDPNGATEHEAGNQFDAIVNDVAYSIEFLAGTNTTVGSSIDAVLYHIDFTASPPAYTEIARSANYLVTAADMTTPKSLELIDASTGNSSPALVAGETYYAGIHSFDNSFQWATSGVGPAPGTPTATHSSVSFPSRAAATTTYSLTGTPMIRLNLDPLSSTVGIDEAKNDVKFNIFPNPSNGVFNINITSNEANNVQLSVKNIVGQTVITKTVNVAGKTKETISLADYSKGVYFLTVGNETVKLIVE